MVRSRARRMHERVLQWIDLFRPYVDDYGYLVLFLGVMAENASLPVPGETILIIASFYSYLGNLSLAHVIPLAIVGCILGDNISFYLRSEEHTSELQSRGHLVCRLLLEKTKKHRLTAS